MLAAQLGDSPQRRIQFVKGNLAIMKHVMMVSMLSCQPSLLCHPHTPSVDGVHEWPDGRSKLCLHRDLFLIASQCVLCRQWQLCTRQSERMAISSLHDGNIQPARVRLHMTCHGKVDGCTLFGLRNGKRVQLPYCICCDVLCHAVLCCTWMVGPWDA